MATIIVEDCTSCGACVEVCPNRAISPGEQIHVIDFRRCTECVGFANEEQCAKVCPVDACLPDPDRQETREALLARARAQHPGPAQTSSPPPRHRR